MSPTAGQAAALWGLGAASAACTPPEKAGPCGKPSGAPAARAGAVPHEPQRGRGAGACSSASQGRAFSYRLYCRDC